MNRKIKVQWGSGLVDLTWKTCDPMPPVEKITSVHGCCFEKGKILLVHIKGRGFTFPGGHIEAGETPEEAFHREVLEEGCVRGRINRIGMIEVNHEKNPEFDPKGKYPLIGYQLFFRMDIEEVCPFIRNNESLCRIWVEPAEIPYVINDHELALEAFKEAAKADLNTII
ncbi:NUDIX domain-containing protein [Rossellomorea vietnamensis]|uniref:NUDIX domain-containing protein n=1 Tax=Rossellomorea vietnamensis TaxID=218284 RepID=A0A5D4M931_9BACI|nr:MULTISPECIES: NUDIX domain-containing protein [Bacillaceae]TYR98008.1 NUDIX domain-containing protein [Rossellomorea vietnamensis]